METRRWSFTKRAFDVVAASVALLVLAPLLGLLCLAVLLSSGGPVVFRQQRVGRDGRLFDIVKLRTMVPGATDLLDSDPELRERHRRGGFKLRVDEDPRITRVGRWLRRTSLDELPQLLNVLAGSMALVGPRPVVPDELLALFGEDADRYCRVRPGMTGPWQVGRGVGVSAPLRRRLDVAYAAQWSFSKDVALLLRTPGAVVRAARTGR